MENVEAVVVCRLPKSQLKNYQHSLQEGHSIVKREIKRCFSAPDHGECLSQNKTVGSSLSDSSESNSSSFKNGLVGSDCGLVEKCGSNVSNYFEISRVDTTMKQNSKKKSKKRWKHKNKLNDDSCVELETSFENKLNCRSTVETSTVDVYHTDESMSRPATDPNYMDDCNNSISNQSYCCSGIPKTYSPFVDYMHSLDDVLPSSIKNCTSEYHLDNSDCRMVLAHYPVSSEEEACCHRNNGDDECENFVINQIDGEGLDSVSVSWNGDSGTDIDGLSVKSDVVISSKQRGFSSDFALSHMNCVSAVINSGRMEETCHQLCNINSMSIGQSITPAKKGKQIKKVPRNFSACRTGNGVNSRYLKENNHSVWQRVKKNDVGCIDELKKVNTEIDVNSGHEYKRSGRVESISKSEGKVISKTKASGKLKRKTIPGARGETSCSTRKGSYAVKTSSPNKVNDVNPSQKLIISAEINQEDDCRGAPAASEGTSLSIDTDDFNSSDCPEVKITTESACLVVDTDDLHHINQVCTETWRQESGCFSVQPVGVDEPTTTYSVISENTMLSEVDELDISDCNIERNKGSVSYSSGVISSSPSLKCDDDIVVKLRNQVSIGHDGKPGAENDPWKLSKLLIEEAINDVCRVQVESEAASQKSGSPIAEFERLLYPATPVICSSFKLRNCERCVKESDVGTSLCGHESPNISLGNLWKWYEKHGSYGLEVRTDGCEKSTRFAVDCHDHRAYFVPSLSAVQLFGCCENHDVNYTINTSGRTKWSEDPYLIFEYFEFQQPPQRRPLFEKIKELVLGDGQCRSYGDPTILNSFHLCDLHPISWYAVAWYPIYKIPDGNFRAAFLTYHSPCQLLRRNTTDDPTESCIVSPVVGLQSYNAQGEGWFRVKQIPIENASEIVESRVRSLEKTASLMSRAAVFKGSVTSTNRHPDYDFFISRRS